MTLRLDGEQLRPGAPDLQQATCGLPGCGKALYIEWMGSRPVYLSDTALELAEPADAYTSSWEVVCEGGHTILVPIDSAEDSYTFGECKCDGADDWCGHHDMDRLRAVIGPDAVALTS